MRISADATRARRGRGGASRAGADAAGGPARAAADVGLGGPAAPAGGGQHRRGDCFGVHGRRWPGCVAWHLVRMHAAAEAQLRCPGTYMRAPDAAERGRQFGIPRDAAGCAGRAAMHFCIRCLGAAAPWHGVRWHAAPHSMTRPRVLGSGVGLRDQAWVADAGGVPVMGLCSGEKAPRTGAVCSQVYKSPNRSK